MKYIVCTVSGRYMEKFMKSNLPIIGKVLAVVISVCCIAFMGYLHFSDKGSRAETEAVVAEVNEGTRAEEKTQSVQAAKAKAAREKTDSFYQKLADGFNVNILVVGDTLASGYGASGADKTWSALLAQELRDIYGIQVEMDNLALIDSDAYSAYSQIKTLDEKMEYDLCIVCTGAYDTNESLAYHYEAILRAIGDAFKKCSIVTVLENTEGTHEWKSNIIRNLSDVYKAAVADTITPSGENLEPYVIDGRFLNDEGQVLYEKAILKTIMNGAKHETPYEKVRVKAQHNETSKYDAFYYVPADDFSREDNQFSFAASFDGALAIDYELIPGDTSMQFYIDGEPIVGYDSTNYYGANIERAQLIGDNIRVRRRVTVVFGNEEQANGFHGIYFSPAG